MTLKPMKKNLTDLLYILVSEPVWDTTNKSLNNSVRALYVNLVGILVENEVRVSINDLAYYPIRDSLCNSLIGLIHKTS